MTYVDGIKPRLTPPPRDVNPVTCTAVLVDFTRDIEQELTARCEQMSDADLVWRPHPDQNNVNVTVWHVARWLDVLGTRWFTGDPAPQRSGASTGGRTRLATTRPAPGFSVAATLQGSSGHIGEIDALVSLRARTAPPSAQVASPAPG